MLATPEGALREQGLLFMLQIINPTDSREGDQITTGNNVNTTPAFSFQAWPSRVER